MIHSLLIPDEYTRVILVGVGTVWVTIWQTTLVKSYRNRAGIEYPQAYAEKTEVQASKDALMFNCAQRAHLNTMETYPQVISLLLFSGLKYPTVATCFGASWIVGRIVYTLGYTSGDPSRHRWGALGGMAYIGLLLTSTWSAGQLALAHFNF